MLQEAYEARGLSSPVMAFGRRKSNSNARDPFAHLADERSEAEGESPWFLEPDDGPELEIQTGISSNLSVEDLEPDDRDGTLERD